MVGYAMRDLMADLADDLCAGIEEEKRCIAGITRNNSAHLLFGHLTMLEVHFIR